MYKKVYSESLPQVNNKSSICYDPSCTYIFIENFEILLPSQTPRVIRWHFMTPSYHRYLENSLRHCSGPEELKRLAVPIVGMMNRPDFAGLASQLPNLRNMIGVLSHCWTPEMRSCMCLPNKNCFKKLFQKKNESIRTEGLEYDPNYEAPEVFMTDCRGYISNTITLSFDSLD